MSFELQDEVFAAVDTIEEIIHSEVGKKKFRNLFKIDPEFYKKKGIEINLIIAQRFCKKKHLPKITSFLSTRSIEVEGHGEISDPLEVIKLCCSQKEDYLPSKLPMAEKIFRVFLKNGNIPLNTYQIGRELGCGNFREYQYIYDLLSNDEFYGFTLVKE